MKYIEPIRIKEPIRTNKDQRRGKLGPNGRNRPTIFKRQWPTLNLSLRSLSLSHFDKSQDFKVWMVLDNSSFIRLPPPPPPPPPMRKLKSFCSDFKTNTNSSRMILHRNEQERFSPRTKNTG